MPHFKISHLSCERVRETTETGETAVGGARGIPALWEGPGEDRLERTTGSKLGSCGRPGEKPVRSSKEGRQ